MRSLTKISPYADNAASTPGVSLRGNSRAYTPGTTLFERRPDANTVTHWIRHHTGGTGTARLLLLTLSERAGTDSRFSFAAVTTLAEDIRRTRRHTRRLLRWLEEEGYIRVHVGGGMRTRKGTTNVYEVLYRDCECGSTHRDPVDRFDMTGRPRRWRGHGRPRAGLGSISPQGGHAYPPNLSPPPFNLNPLVLKRSACGESDPPGRPIWPHSRP